MPLFRLTPRPIFPPVELANPDGLLAFGGDLTPERLIAAYRAGIFPWYMPGEPILWWSPDPRLILKPEWLHLPSSLKKVMRQGRFRITYDQAFAQVIHACAQFRGKERSATWITSEMESAYIRLHHMGYAHSVEAWSTGGLAGGLYGIAMGACFFGESMFFREADASKVAFATMVGYLSQLGLRFIDCQMTTQHLVRFGAREVPRREFLGELQAALCGDLFLLFGDGVTHPDR